MPLYVVVALVVIGIGRTWLTGLRWRFLNPDVTAQLKAWHYFRFAMIAHTFNLVMPGALGGDFVKTAFTLKAVEHHRIHNVMAIILDRFVGLLSILFLGTVAFLLLSDIPDKTAFYTYFGILYGILIVLIVLALNSHLHKLLISCFARLGKIGLWLNNVISIWKETVKYFSLNKRKVFHAGLICLPIHLASFCTTYYLAVMLNIRISFLEISLITSLVWIVTAVPITISGAGIREFSMIYLLSLYGIEGELATALSLYTYIISIILGLIGLLFMVEWGKYISKFS